MNSMPTKPNMSSWLILGTTDEKLTFRPKTCTDDFLPDKVDPIIRAVLQADWAEMRKIVARTVNLAIDEIRKETMHDLENNQDGVDHSTVHPAYSTDSEDPFRSTALRPSRDLMPSFTTFKPSHRTKTSLFLKHLTGNIEVCPSFPTEFTCSWNAGFFKTFSLDSFPQITKQITAQLETAIGESVHVSITPIGPIDRAFGMVCNEAEITIFISADTVGVVKGIVSANKPDLEKEQDYNVCLDYLNRELTGEDVRYLHNVVQSGELVKVLDTFSPLMHGSADEGRAGCVDHMFELLEKGFETKEAEEVILENYVIAYDGPTGGYNTSDSSAMASWLFQQDYLAAFPNNLDEIKTLSKKFLRQQRAESMSPDMEHEWAASVYQSIEEELTKSPETLSASRLKELAYEVFEIELTLKPLNDNVAASFIVESNQFSWFEHEAMQSTMEAFKSKIAIHFLTK